MNPPLRIRVAKRLVIWLEEKDADGNTTPPGARTGFREREVDGRELAVLPRGDAVDLYFATKRDVVAFSCDPTTALNLAVWILWHWWAKALWFGWKLVWWTWAMDVLSRRRR